MLGLAFSSSDRLPLMVVVSASTNSSSGLEAGRPSSEKEVESLDLGWWVQNADIELLQCQRRVIH